MAVLGQLPVDVLQTSTDTMVLPATEADITAMDVAKAKLMNLPADSIVTQVMRLLLQLANSHMLDQVGDMSDKGKEQSDMQNLQTGVAMAKAHADSATGIYTLGDDGGLTDEAKTMVERAIKVHYGFPSTPPADGEEIPLFSSAGPFTADQLVSYTASDGRTYSVPKQLSKDKLEVFANNIGQQITNIATTISTSSATINQMAGSLNQLTTLLNSFIQLYNSIKSMLSQFGR